MRALRIRWRQIKENGTNREVTTQTNDQGFYEARNLPPGSYAVRVEQTGFSTATVENVVVQTGQVAKTDVTMTKQCFRRFKNIDWTIVHVLGADITGSTVTYSLRFGYVNFNNRIESQQLVAFPTTPQGTTYQLDISDLSIGPNSLAPQQTHQHNSGIF